MKQFNGFDEAKKAAQFTASAKLPEGAYVAKILGVKFEEGQNGLSDRIAIQFDIAEGEYKDFSRISMTPTQTRIRSGRAQLEFMFQQMTAQKKTAGQKQFCKVDKRF